MMVCRAHGSHYLLFAMDIASTGCLLAVHTSINSSGATSNNASHAHSTHASRNMDQKRINRKVNIRRVKCIAEDCVCVASATMREPTD